MRRRRSSASPADSSATSASNAGPVLPGPVGIRSGLTMGFLLGARPAAPAGATASACTHAGAAARAPLRSICPRSPDALLTVLGSGGEPSQPGRCAAQPSASARAAGRRVALPAAPKLALLGSRRSACASAGPKSMSAQPWT